MFSSGAQSCLTLCDPMDCSTPGLRVHHQLPEFTQTHVHWVSDTIQGGDTMQEEKETTEDVVVLLLQSIFPSIRVFSNESVFRIRWPKYWSFSIIINPSNEYSGLSYVNKGNINFFINPSLSPLKATLLVIYKPLVITLMLIFFSFLQIWCHPNQYVVILDLVYEEC